MIPLSLRTALLVALLSLPALLVSQEVNGRFNTAMYSWEQFDTVNSSSVIVRAMQNFQLDVKQGDVTLHTSLYGAMNLSGTDDEQAMIRARQLYLKWKALDGTLDLSVGRVPVFAGVGMGAVDGAMAKVWLCDRRVSVLGYGGANVTPSLSSKGLADLDKNYLAGAQIAGTLAGGVRVGLSYVNRNMQRDSYTTMRPDSAFNPISVNIVPEFRAEQIAGADIRYTFSDALTTYGRFDYDLNAKRSLRGQLYARYDVTECVAVTGEFIYREPRIMYNSFFRMFPVSPSREVEGGLEYSFNPSIRAYGKFAYVRYTDEVSRRITVGLSTNCASIGYSGASGYAGELASVDAQVMIPLLERKVIPTIGVSYGSYIVDASLDERQEVFAGSLGGVFRPLAQFSIDAQAQWLKTPVAKDDVRFFAKINYWFHTNLNLFTDAPR
jgi:hypothetical protein